MFWNCAFHILLSILRDLMWFHLLTDFVKISNIIFYTKIRLEILYSSSNISKIRENKRTDSLDIVRITFDVCMVAFVNEICKLNDLNNILLHAYNHIINRKCYLWVTLWCKILWTDPPLQSFLIIIFQHFLFN